MDTTSSAIHEDTTVLNAWLDAMAEEVESNGFAVRDNISRYTNIHPRKARAEAEGQHCPSMKTATISKGSANSTEVEKRSDRCTFLRPATDSNLKQSSPHLHAHTTWVDACLRLGLEKRLGIGMEKCTFMLAEYPGGGSKYVKHRDAAPSDYAGRKLTCIYYLNDNWQPSDGGELRIWPRSLDSDVLAAQQEKEEQEPTNDSGGNVSNVTTTTTSNADDKNSAFEVITPVIDRLVVFKSGLEHEVAPAHFHRIALTAWMVNKKHLALELMCEQLQLKQDEIEAKDEVKREASSAATSASPTAPKSNSSKWISPPILDTLSSGEDIRVEEGKGVPWARFAALLQSHEERVKEVCSTAGEDLSTKDASFDAEALVARGAILGHQNSSSSSSNHNSKQPLSGWRGEALEWTTRQPLTFLPASPKHTTVFSDSAHRDEVAVVKPSMAYWQWLVATSSRGTPDEQGSGAFGWQMRGGLKLSPQELASLLGPSFSKAAQLVANSSTSSTSNTGRVRVENASVWAGAGGTRTPLHVDMVHALVFQVAGTKRWLLAREQAVENAIDQGSLPEAVLSSGETHDFLEEGSLKSVYGADDTEDERDEEGTGTSEDKSRSISNSNESASSTPSHGINRARRKIRKAHKRLLGARIVTLREGDCLLVPAGLYHDVESSADTGPALSITVRFSCHPYNCPIGRTPATDRASVNPSGSSGGRNCSDDVVPPNNNACVRPFGHWGAHVSESGDVCSSQSNLKVDATTAASAAAAATVDAVTGGQETKAGLGAGTEHESSKKGAMFQRWRESISSSSSSSSNSSTSSNNDSSNSNSMGTSSCATEPDNSTGAMFRRWRKSTISDRANNIEINRSSCSNAHVSNSPSNESDSSQKQMFSKWRQMTSAAAPNRTAPAADSLTAVSKPVPVANTITTTNNQSGALFQRWKDETRAATNTQQNKSPVSFAALKSTSNFLKKDPASSEEAAISTETAPSTTHTAVASAIDLDVDE